LFQFDDQAFEIREALIERSGIAGERPLPTGEHVVDGVSHGLII
jgi:hypothetical protein